MNVTFRPLPIWPHPQTRDRRSAWTFKAGWQNTIDLLAREVGFLDGRNVIIGVGLREQDIRRDGLPRAGARAPVHPGIELGFDSRHGRLAYATDTCARWEHNVRSIALGLQALRAVDRYGITRTGEQYAGWKALPSPQSGLDDRGRRIIREYGGDVRRALQATHPDHGGNPEDFEAVQAARGGG